MSWLWVKAATKAFMAFVLCDVSRAKYLLAKHRADRASKTFDDVDAKLKIIRARRAELEAEIAKSEKGR
jgi:cell division protein FtsB